MLKQMLRFMTGAAMGILLVIGLSGFTAPAAAMCDDFCWTRPTDGATCCYNCDSGKTACVLVICRTCEG